MNRGAEHPGAVLWLTVPISILLAIAAGGGLFVNGLYRDAPNFVAQAVAQDLISLAIVLPILITAALLAGRGSRRALLIWQGALVYLVYSYAIAVFDVKFNSLFLVYVGLFGCSLYALIGGLVASDLAGTKASFTEKTPARAVSIYLALLAILFYLLWLGEIVPAIIAGSVPQSVQDNGTATNAVQVLDMAWILPAFGITAVTLWRQQALGYTLAGAMLTYVVLLISSVLSMVAFMVRGGFPVAVPQVVIFGALFAVSLVMLIWYMRGLGSTPPPAHAK